ncbi:MULTISPECIES: M3 family metallopeptidase [Bartonella]|uniref:M3 family metallopeptidase n=1 Tax=Bartonella TaxID=773 RepID=UPI0018DDAFD1|nr:MULTISPECIES: M3 family metallopeptidase [Bartonella]MBH9974273.1 M3 family metallopeptidase [Bartonella choladocola]MBI0013880.1 M3 family metallopeptidase [Bartonella sp. B10834G3]
MSKTALLEWSGFEGLPDFSKIHDEDFKPAFEEALKDAEAEIEQIAASPEPATIDGFLQAFELAGQPLDHVCSVFFLRSGAYSNELIQQLEQDFVPKLSRYSSKLMMDPRLFAKIDALHEEAKKAKFDAETTRVIELTWKGFVRNGALLDEKDKKRLAEINERLALLGAQFGQHVLNDEAEWVLYLEKNDLAGLPDDLVATMKETAKERGKPDSYALTLARSIVEPFLTFSDRRDLRQIAFEAWAKRGENGNKNDNRDVIKEIIALRDEKAKLLGFKSFAAFKLDNTMAKTPDNVMKLLMPVWKRAVAKAEKEADALQKLAAQTGSNDELAAWDWRYYAEKLRSKLFSFDEASVKVYFELDKMIEAAFATAKKLFGVSFEEKRGVPLWHEDARLFEVKNPDGSLRGLFIGDYFARPSKRSGAWMSELQTEHHLGKGRKPIIYNICNFAKPPKGKPALLSLDDARTLFHEFGHALHGLLSEVKWPSVSGTSVARDFVELPSQLFEHWVTVPETLKTYARNVKTGEPMPQELLDKVLAARTFNGGFDAVEFTASALVDMAFHEGGKVDDPTEFEKKELKKLGMPKAIIMRHRPPHFTHVFTGDGYSAGYYSYMWAEVLDSDAFEAFEETGNAFDPATAEKLKKYIYSAGGSRDPEELYKAFRGRLPSPDALMRKRGI